MDLGHPGILQANRYAVSGDYDRALKGWSYVVFEPVSFGESERFTFGSELYTRLRQARLPQDTLKALLRLYGKSYSLKEMNPVLIALLERQDFQRYSAIIKFYARTSRPQDGQNLRLHTSTWALCIDCSNGGHWQLIICTSQRLSARNQVCASLDRYADSRWQLQSTG